jgi:hypothetical protein
MALSWNPSIRCVNKDYFMPQEPGIEANEKVSLEKLDMMFKEFQEKYGASGGRT